jgi:hypothetical protein
MLLPKFRSYYMRVWVMRAARETCLVVSHSLLDRFGSIRVGDGPHHVWILWLGRVQEGG